MALKKRKLTTNHYFLTHVSGSGELRTWGMCDSLEDVIFGMVHIADGETVKIPTHETLVKFFETKGCLLFRSEHFHISKLDSEIK